MVFTQTLRSAFRSGSRVSRGFQTSARAQGGGHSTGSYEDYIHAPNMYNLEKMKNRKLFFGTAISGLVLGGCGIGWFAISFQQAKTRSA
ncbi:hypothetical protein BSKO_07878 [Bryopsis sp. KO-2023]|nr:hypothetical protein BSKO_07878 [Bryopsis sp. KO-2023]